MSHMTRRQFVSGSLAAGAGLIATSVSERAHGRRISVNDQLNLGFIGCGGRAGQLMKHFSTVENVNFAGLCDPDGGRLAAAKTRNPKAKTWKDLRHLIDDDDIDAVVITTCNHWHCLAAIWAMEAGKDVYVEKPLSHTQWEGRQVVNAARKYNKICQVGTQQRSDPMQAEIKEFLHKEKTLGEIVSARCNHYGRRGSIGKRATQLPIPENMAYDLWLGPAQDKPIFRDKLQYDWHWDWNTGSGDMGNWGVHIMDDLRNNVFQDKVAFPKRICGGGGRVVWNDAGETPNVHFVWFDTGSIPVVMALSNLPGAPGKREAATHPGPGSGYIAYCEGGRLEGQRGRAAAFDRDGTLIKSFRGNSGGDMHQRNFVDAVRKGDASMLNTDVEIGHQSTGWCNLANVAYRAGASFSEQTVAEVTQDNEPFEELINAMKEHLAAYDIDIASGPIRLCPILEFDPKTESFVGDHAEEAGRFLKRQYRDGYAVPEVGRP